MPDQPTTSAAAFVEAEVAKKRATVGMASTVLDPLPSSRTTDTAVILQALDSAIDLLEQTDRGATGLSSRGRDVLSRLNDAAIVVRARIRQEQPR